MLIMIIFLFFSFFCFIDLIFTFYKVWIEKRELQIMFYFLFFLLDFSSRMFLLNQHLHLKTDFVLLHRLGTAPGTGGAVCGVLFPQDLANLYVFI